MRVLFAMHIECSKGYWYVRSSRSVAFFSSKNREGRHLGYKGLDPARYFFRYRQSQLRSFEYSPVFVMEVAMQALNI